MTVMPVAEESAKLNGRSMFCTPAIVGGRCDTTHDAGDVSGNAARAGTPTFASVDAQSVRLKSAVPSRETDAASGDEYRRGGYGSCLRGRNRTTGS